VPRWSSLGSVVVGVVLAAHTAVGENRHGHRRASPTQPRRSINAFRTLAISVSVHTATFMHHHHSVRSDLDTKPLLCWWPEIVACSRRCNSENTTLSLAVATDTVSGGPPGTSERRPSRCPLRDPVRGQEEVVRLPRGPSTNQWSIGAASLVRRVGGKPAPSAVGLL
jgi:hypothetical protein